MDDREQLNFEIRRLYDQSCVWRRWVELYQKQIKVESYFLKRNIRKIAIYGMAQIGNSLYEELQNSSIEVAYCIDKNRGGCRYPVEVRNLEQISDDIDCIVVTAVTFFEQICGDIREKSTHEDIEIVGIDEILVALLVEDMYEVED